MLMKFPTQFILTLSLAVCVFTSSVNAQATQSVPVFRPNNANIPDDLDPTKVPSELIQGSTRQTQSTGLPIPPKVQPDTNAFQRVNNRPKNNPIQLQSPKKIEQNKLTTQPTMVRPIPQVIQKSTSSRGGFNTVNNQQQTPLTSVPQKIDSSMFEAKSTPTIQTQIVAPRTINVNQTARLFVQANNVGKVDVTQMKLVAILPDHAKFVSSSPQPTNVDGQRYEFTIRSLTARAKQTVQIDVIPTTKKPLNISTQIQIESQQQVAVAVKQPVLEVSVSGPDAIQTGQTLTHQVVVKNTGDGIAQSVRINARRPEQLDGVQQPQKTLVPQLVPGQIAKFQLSSFARTAGQADIVFQVSANGAETSEGRAAVRVIRPELGVEVLGPARNYLGRDGVYTIQMKNNSDIAIHDVGVMLRVPAGLQINTISQEAKINQDQGTLQWSFPQISAQGQQAIQFRAKSIAEGDQICAVRVETKETAAREMSLKTEVRSRADLSLRITDSGEPIGVGGKSEFSIEVVNHGSRDANQVNVQVELPAALMPVNRGGYAISPAGNQIAFNAIDVAAGAKKTLKFQVVAVDEGEHVVRGVVVLPGGTQSISSENSIFVFAADNAKVSEALVPEIRR